MATELHAISELHDRDYYAWARQQAEALRRFQSTRPNVPIDFEHLIDAIDGLADETMQAVRSQLRRLVQHLLKLEYSPAARPRRQWLNSVDDARQEIIERMTATVRNELEPQLDEHYALARRKAARDMLDYEETEAAANLPTTCPYTLDQLTDSAWYPTNRHGLTDETP
jgi:hypothetical protein